MPKFDDLWPDMRYATKREYEGGDILKGNRGSCYACGTETQFWDELEHVNICSTECDDVLYADLERSDLAHEYNRLYRAADAQTFEANRVEYSRDTREFKLSGTAISEGAVRAMIAALKRGDSTRPRFVCNPDPLAGVNL